MKLLNICRTEPKKESLEWPFNAASAAAARGWGERRDVHPPTIRARGACIRGIDPASRGLSQVDGRQLLQMYIDLGLRLDTADNAVKAGIYLLRVAAARYSWAAKRGSLASRPRAGASGARRVDPQRDRCGSAGGRS